MLFNLDYFYKVLLHIRKTRSIFAPATHPKALHVLSNGFPPASLRSRLSSWARRARIRNTRGIENGISLNRDTNTIEALAALHIPGPHMMHTESRTNQRRKLSRTRHVTTEKAGRDRDPNNLSVARV